MSPLLFSLFFDRVVKHVETEVQSRHIVHVGGKHVPPDLYADDVALLAPVSSSLTKWVSSLHDFTASEGLRMNAGKTVILQVNG